MPLMSYDYDENTEELFEELKDFFGVKTKSGVIRRSLALAKIAKRMADKKDRTVKISPPSEEGKGEIVSLAS